MTGSARFRRRQGAARVFGNFISVGSALQWPAILVSLARGCGVGCPDCVAAPARGARALDSPGTILFSFRGLPALSGHPQAGESLIGSRQKTIADARGALSRPARARLWAGDRVALLRHAAWRLWRRNHQ